MPNSQNQRFGANQENSTSSINQSRDVGGQTYTTSGANDYGTTYNAGQSSYAGTGDRSQTGAMGGTYSTGATSQNSSLGTSGFGSTGTTPGGYSSTGSTSNPYTNQQQADYPINYNVQNTGGYGQPPQTGISNYGVTGGISSNQLQQNASTSPAVNLTQAGVSNFSQQINSAYQQLQQVQRELIQAQNQIEVQAQAQIRQLRQLQQLIENAGSEVQQIESVSRIQSSTRNYPLS